MHVAPFGGQIFSLCCFYLGDVSHQIWTQDIACLWVMDLIISIIVISPDNFPQLSQSAFVFQNLCEGKGCAGLPVD